MFLFTFPFILFISFLLLTVFLYSINFKQDHPLIILDNSAKAFFSENFLNAYFHEFMVYITLYGREYTWGPVIIALFLLGGEVGRKTAIITGLSILILVMIGGEIKNIIDRDRPELSNNIYLLEEDSKKSYPYTSWGSRYDRIFSLRSSPRKNYPPS